MQHLQELIRKEQQNIDENLQREDPKVKYYQEFCQKYNIINIADLSEVEPCDLVIFFLASSDLFQDIAAIKDAVSANRNFIEHLMISDEIDELRNAIKKTSESNAKKHLKEVFSYKKGASPLTLVKKEYRSTLPILRIVTANKGEYEPFVKLLNLTDVSLDEVMDSLMIIPLLREIKNLRKKTLPTTKRSNKTTSEGLKIMAISNTPQDYLSAIITQKESFIMARLTASRKNYEAKEQKERSKKRSLNRQKKLYEEITSKLQALIQANKLIDIEDLILKIPNERIRLEVLKLVYRHNQNIAKNIECEYKRLSANNENNYISLLNKYNINIPNDISSIMNNSLEDLEAIICLLSRVNITSSDDVIKILQSSNLGVVLSFQSLIDKGIITEELLQQHKKLYIPTSNEYQNFMENLAYLQENKLNPYYFTSSQETFLLPPQKLVEGLNVIEDYKLTQAMKAGISYKFLSSSDLSKAIDTLLELGYEEKLLENIDILNYKDKYPRLQILKSLNIQVSSTEELLKVLTTPTFYVPDDKISEYLYTAEETSLIPELKHHDLEEFSSSPRTYNFAGILISKNKVKRNLNEDDCQQDIFKAIVKGSILSDEELDILTSSLNSEKNARVVKQKIE